MVYQFYSLQKDKEIEIENTENDNHKYSLPVLYIPA